MPKQTLQQKIRRALGRFTAKRIAMILLGTAILSFGIHNIHRRTAITEGGVIGLVLLINHWLGVPASVASPLLDAASYALAFKFLGWDFLLSAGVASVSLAGFYRIWECLPPMLPDLTPWPLAAALLSTFLTNDVALFIVVPLTITLKRLCEIPVNRLIIFEALAVNAGSLLTPIGNPQNILIWGRSGLSFAGFIAQMAPLAGAMMLTLLLLCWCCFPGKALQYHTGVQTPEWKPRLVWSCLGLYIVFLTALELKQELWGLVIVAAGFALLARRVVLSVDWTLLLVFMAMFIDVHLLTQLPALQGVLGNVSHLSEPGLWLTAIGLSQVISNVPSTILLLNYVPPSLLLAWAVNVGGFGLLPGSLANLIALRMANDRRIWWRFHLYSIPMLLWAALVGYVLFVMLPAW